MATAIIEIRVAYLDDLIKALASDRPSRKACGELSMDTYVINGDHNRVMLFTHWNSESALNAYFTCEKLKAYFLSWKSVTMPKLIRLIDGKY